MKHLLMLFVCVALVMPGAGCCWTHGMGYGNAGCAPGGACGTPYGQSPGLYQGAYYGGTTTTAGIPTYAPAYPTTATINPLPTY